MLEYLKKLKIKFKTWKSASNPATISIKNVKNFIQAEYRKNITGFDNLPQYKQEQILWRSIVAKPCTDNKSCLYCGCSTEDLELYFGDDGCKRPTYPCFPNLMSRNEWKKYKKENQIKIKQ